MQIAKLKTLALAWLAALLAWSCAAVQPLDKDRQELNAAEVCCMGYEQFNFVPLNVGDSQNLTINRSSPAFLFETGKSYFQAFRLPVANKPYAVIIQSHFIETRTRSETSYVFSPAVVFLDAGYRVTRRLDKSLNAAVGTGDSLGTANLELQIRIDPRSAEERFMVIYTTATLLDKPTILGVYKYARGGTIEDHYPVPNAPVGELKVSLTSAIN